MQHEVWGIFTFHFKKVVAQSEIGWKILQHYIICDREEGSSGRGPERESGRCSEEERAIKWLRRGQVNARKGTEGGE